jgi:hypothetical protein
MYDKYFGDKYAGERGYEYDPSKSYVPRSELKLFSDLQPSYHRYDRPKVYRETQKQFQEAYKNLPLTTSLSHRLPDLSKYDKISVKKAEDMDRFMFKDNEDAFGLRGFQPGKAMRKLEPEDIEQLKLENEAIWNRLPLQTMHPDDIKMAAQQLFNVKRFQKNYDENGINLLANLIAFRQHDIRHNPALASLETAEEWLNKMITKYPHIYTDWFIETGDFDNDPNTPETILVKDSKGRIVFVDGYSLGSGQKDKRKKMLYNLYPSAEDRRAFNSNETDSKLRSLVYKWFDLTDKERSTYNNDFAQFARAYIAKHPKFKKTPEFRQIHSFVSFILKGYKAKDQLDPRYKRLYLSCLARTASFFNELVKNKMINLEQFLTEDNKEEILKVFTIMYEFAKERNKPHELAPELPLKGWDYFSNF